MRFVTFVYKNVLRRPARSVLTVLGLAVAMAAVVSLVGVSNGFERSFLHLYDKWNVDLVVQKTGGTHRMLNGIDERMAAKIAELPRVKSAFGGLMDVVAFEDHNLFAVVINGWSPDCPLYDGLKYLPGSRRLQAGDEHKVLLGRVLAANLQKKVGDTIDIYAEPFEVAGVFESTSVYENGAVVILLSELQRLMDRPNEVTGLLVEAEPGTGREQLAELQRQIAALGPDISAEPTGEYVSSINQIRVSRAMAWLTSVIALVIGSIGILNTMIMSVFERTREIGTLRAIGWRKSRIVGMIVGEGLLLSVLGGVVGTLAAMAMLSVLSNMPATSGVIDGRIAPAVVAQGFVIAVLVGVAGAAYPAWWGASLLPTEALRGR